MLMPCWTAAFLGDYFYNASFISFFNAFKSLFPNNNI